MALHNTLAKRLHVNAFFCDAHSACKRGSNQNANGIIRELLPKGLDLSAFSAKNLSFWRGMIPLPLNTRSLRLRHILVDDAVRMMELNAEPSTRQWLPSHVYANEQEAIERMKYLTSCYSEPGDPRVGPYVLAVDHLASGTLLGHVGFSPFYADVEVSYAIAESHRQRGYGCEALSAACLWAARSFGLQSLLALTESANAPSRLTLERARFVHVEESLLRFQGTEQKVSRYLWRPSTTQAQ